MLRVTKPLLSLLIVVVVTGGVPSSGRAQAAEAETPKEVRTGIELIRRGRYDEAVDRFQVAIEKSPQSRAARLGLSWAYLKQRQFPPSVEQALKVLESDPENARAHALIGAALMRVGVLPEATVAFQRALKSDPNEPLALAGVAELDMYAGDLRLSVQHAQSAVSRSPREPDFLYLLGQSAARQERFDVAADAYDRYLSVAPDVDSDRRARIRGLVQLYRRLSGRNLYLVGGNRTVDVPISLTDSRLPVIDVMVNGKGPFHFVIDSGAGFVVVSEEIARKLKIRPVAAGGTSRGVSGTGRFNIVYGVIDRLEIGTVSVESIPTYIRKVLDPGKQHIDGYVGLSVLSNFKVSVDYEHRVLEMRPKDAVFEPIGEDDVVVPYRMTNGGMMSISVDIGKEVPLNFIVDTGASSTVVSRRAFDKFDLAAKQHKGVGVRVVGAGGVTENAPVIVLDKLMINGSPNVQEFVRAIVLDLDPINETAGFEQGGIIGSDLLRLYRVEFDFDRGTVVLRPNSRRAESAPVTHVPEAVH